MFVPEICPKLFLHFDHGTVSYSKPFPEDPQTRIDIGLTATYSCAKNRVLRGTGKVFCNSKGKWDKLSGDHGAWQAPQCLGEKIFMQLDFLQTAIHKNISS